MTEMAQEETLVDDVLQEEASIVEEELSIDALFEEKPAKTEAPGEAGVKTEAELAKEKLKTEITAAEIASITKSVLTGLVDGNVNRTTTPWFVWLVGTVLVYAIAALGLSFIFVLLTVPIVLFLRQLAIKRMARRSLHYATAASLRRHLPDHESVEWINNLFATVWTNYRKFIEAEVQAKAAVKLNESLPTQIKRVDLEKFSMGDFPPRLEDFKVFKHNTKQLVLDASLIWDSTLQVAVAVTPAIGGGKLPLARFSVRDLFLSVRVRLTVDLVQNVYPFARRAALQLTEAPQMDVGVAALGLRVLELPGVDWVKRLVIKNLCELLCHPARVEVDVLRLLGLNEADVLERERSAKEKVSRLKGAAGAAGKLISGTVGAAADLGKAALKGGGKAVVAMGGGAIKGATVLGGGAMKGATALSGGAMKGAGKLGSVGKGALSGAAHLTGSSVRSIGGKMGMTTKKITLAPEEERELAALADEVEGVMEEEEGGYNEGEGDSSQQQQVTRAVSGVPGSVAGVQVAGKGTSTALEASGGENENPPPPAVHKRKKSLLQKLF